jgi:hypothetical protein
VATKSDRKAIPAYVSYKFFTSFINDLRENSAAIPQQIDSSVFPKASGSAKSAMLVSLRFLRLIEDGGKPTPLLHKLVECPEAGRPAVLKEVLLGAYPFLLADSTLHIDRASSTQVTERFRAQEITGSTVAKAMVFFLAAAADAGVKVSPHVKAPPVPKNGAKRTPRGGRRDDERDDQEDEVDDEEGPDDALERFQLPIPGKRAAMLSVPRNLSPEDWVMLTGMFDLYVKRLQASRRALAEQNSA